MPTVISTAAGGLYHQGTTWTGGIVPTSGDDVVIATTTGNEVLISQASGNDAKTMTINNDATLHMGSGGVLDLYGNFTGNQGGAYYSLGARLIMDEDGAGNGAQIILHTDGSTFYMRQFTYVEIGGSGDYAVGAEPIKITTSGVGVNWTYIYFYRCVGEIGNLYISRIDNGSSMCTRLTNKYRPELGDYALHLYQITVEEWTGYCMQNSESMHLHADTLITFQKPTTLPTNTVGFTNMEIMGLGKITVDLSDWTGAQSNGLFGGNVYIYGEVEIELIDDDSKARATLKGVCGLNSAVHTLDRSILRMDIYQKITVINAYGYSNHYYRLLDDGSVAAYMQGVWESGGDLEIECRNSKRLLVLQWGPSTYMWFNPLSGFRCRVSGTLTDPEDVYLGASPERVNSFTMTTNQIFINESNRKFFLDNQFNQNEPMLYSTDELLYEGILQWDFQYPANRDDTNSFILTDAEFEITTFGPGRLRIDPNGSIIMLAQPISFVNGLTGFYAEESGSGTSLYEFRVSEDGGVTWGAWKTLNDANWAAEGVFMGFGTEVIAVRLSEVGGANPIYFTRLRLPLQYKEPYVSQLNITDITTQNLGYTTDLRDIDIVLDKTTDPNHWSEIYYRKDTSVVIARKWLYKDDGTVPVDAETDLVVRRLSTKI